MSQSLSKLYVHLIFHVKDNQIGIRPSDASRVYSYIGGIIKQKESIPVRIGGMPDHIHILCVLSKNTPLSKLVQEIKKQ
ncbi:Transposase IS200 like protein [Bacteroidales bacterium Barb6XT]|nr:Transposase IS200 like protein [Bacteroidales bacterium Barb6XT]